ncbi:MAG: SLC13 family permease, partial [Pseudomonadota bacterium]
VATLMGPLQQSKKAIPSRVLIPLSYASILGGMLTLVGTSTNLIVSAFMVSEGLPALSLFEFTALGACSFLICGIVIVVLSPVLLPANSAAATSERGQYFIEATVMADSPLIGGTVKSNGLRNLENLYLVEVIRPWVRISPVAPNIVIREDDVLVFSGDIQQVEILNQFEGLAIGGENHHSVLNENLLQTVLPHNSELIGRTIVDIDFRARYDAAVVAVCRGHSRILGGLGRVRLRTGDLLVLATGQDFNVLTRGSPTFVVVNRHTPDHYLTPRNSSIALGLFLLALMVSAVGLVSLIKSLCAALALYLVLQLTSMAEIRRRLPINLLIIVGCALGIAQAVLDSGLAHILADGIIGVFSPFGIYGALIGVYLLTLVLTEVITNNASAALVCPIAYSLAISLDQAPLPFFMAVAFAASASFISPYGYQTNLMVFSAGRYRFADYFKMGAPVSIAYSTTVLTGLPLMFPLNS